MICAVLNQDMGSSKMFLYEGLVIVSAINLVAKWKKMDQTSIYTVKITGTTLVGSSKPSYYYVGWVSIRFPLSFQA